MSLLKSLLYYPSIYNTRYYVCVNIVIYIKIKHCIVAATTTHNFLNISPSFPFPLFLYTSPAENARNEERL